MSICGIHIWSRIDGVNRSVVRGGGGWDDGPCSHAAASSRDEGLSAINIFSKIMNNPPDTHFITNVIDSRT